MTKLYEESFNDMFLKPTTQESTGCLACVTFGELVTEWQELSDYEICELWSKSQNDIEGTTLGFTTQEHFFAGMIEAKLKEKNTWIYN